jgi:hypothetical protein
MDECRERLRSMSKKCQAILLLSSLTMTES